MTSAEISGILDVLKAKALTNPHITMLIIGDKTFKFRDIGEEIDKWEARMASALRKEASRRHNRTVSIVHV